MGFLYELNWVIERNGAHERSEILEWFGKKVYDKEIYTICLSICDSYDIALKLIDES